MTRIDDVARLARVSTATVSRALRGLPTVSEATRARVLAAAEELGYSASPSASRLAGGRTGAVAVVVPQIARWFSGTVVQAAGERFRQAGYDLLLYNLGSRRPNRQRMFQAVSLRKRVDGLMLVGTPLAEADLTTLAGLNLPGVTISSGVPVPGWPGVRVDDVAAARTATAHLVALGHRRIAHLSGDGPDEVHASIHRERRRGYRSALRAAGLPADARLDLGAPFTVAGGSAATTALLARGDRPTAIFAGCDEMAIGALAALRAAGLRVPQDVSVIGLDDHELAGALGLTTVAQPAAAQGQLGADLLLAALDRRVAPDRTGPAPGRAGTAATTAGATAGAVTVTADGAIVLPTWLVERATTGPPPV